jgi:hypothetical protein
MVTCAELTAYWDQAIGRFLLGGPAVPPDPRGRSWAEAYRGHGRGEVNLDALPEPYLGALDHRPVGVFLALNPGQAHLSFQGRSGLFADEIRHHGAYSAWAATWPYLRDPWVATMGPNRYLTSRLAFLQTWTGQPTLIADAMVTFELYPWHSTAVTAPMRPWDRPRVRLAAGPPARRAGIRVRQAVVRPA